MQRADADVQELAVPRDAGDGEAFQGGERWVVGLEHADGERQDAGDLLADQVFVEEDPQGLDLR